MASKQPSESMITGDGQPEADIPVKKAKTDSGEAGDDLATEKIVVKQATEKKEVLDLCQAKTTVDRNSRKPTLAISKLPKAVQEALNVSLRTGNELTIEVLFSSPPAPEKKKDFAKVNIHNRYINDKYMYVDNVTQEYARLEQLDLTEVAFELKGTLIRVHQQQLAALINTLQASAQATVLNQISALSLALTDPRQTAVGHCDSKFLIELMALFPQLEQLYLTIGLGNTQRSLFGELIRAIAGQRIDSSLKVLDINVTDMKRSYNGRPLMNLVPQLEHLGLFYREQLITELIGSATPGKLTSLKMISFVKKLLDHGGQWGNKWLSENKAIFEGLTSLAIRNYEINKDLATLMPHCSSLTSLKMHSNFETCYESFPDYHLLAPTLKTLTLVNLDLDHIERATASTQGLSTLNLVNGVSLLEQFRTPQDRMVNVAAGAATGGHRVAKRLYLVNVHSVAEFLATMFPSLQVLTLAGPVFQVGELREKLIEKLSAESGNDGGGYQLQLALSERLPGKPEVLRQTARKSSSYNYMDWRP